jgi:malonyl-CoA/methylmalonyl-CoA synthetase
VRLPDVLSVLDHPDPEAVAVRDAHRQVSYGELACNVRYLAGALARRGVLTRDRVFVSLPNSAASVEVYLACALVGAIWVGINPTAPRAERERLGRALDPRLTVTHGGGVGEEVGGAEVIDVLRADRSRCFDSAAPPLDSPCAVGFSSGTTGTPKAIVHSRQAVSLSAAVLAEGHFRPDDSNGVTLPMSIHNLIVVGAMPALLAGATVVAVEHMNAAAVARACDEFRLTRITALVPATIYDMVEDDSIPREALASLRMASTGAAGLSEELRAAFEGKFGVRLIGSYGMTEAPGAVCVEQIDVPHPEGGSGVALPHVRVNAVDAEGHPLPPNEEGELVVTAREDGPWAGRFRPAMGTWSPSGITLRNERQANLHTGDRGWLAEDGTVHVTGRQVDVIIRGGVNVNAAEIEAVLGQLDDVRGVAVVGAPDVRLGQRIVAFVEPTIGADLDPAELRTRTRGLLSHGKVPDEVVVQQLPRNAMGKVVRSELAQRLENS